MKQKNDVDAVVHNQIDLILLILFAIEKIRLSKTKNEEKKNLCEKVNFTAIINHC